MRTNRIRGKLKAGKPVLFTKVNTTEPVVVDIIGLCGFDCIWICKEHGGIDWDRLGHLIRTAAMNGMDALIRVAKGSYSDYIRPLELGASGLMIPHCKSGDEAREIVQMTRFYPLGRRPLDGGNSDGQYCMIPAERYVEMANEKTFLVVQIEDPEALGRIDDIAAVKGVDALFLGPGDLAHGLGCPGRYDHPEILNAMKRMAEACQKHQKVWGLPVNVETASKYLQMGAMLLSIGADILGLTQYFGGLRNGLEQFGIEFSQKV